MPIYNMIHKYGRLCRNKIRQILKPLFRIIIKFKIDRDIKSKSYELTSGESDSQNANKSKAPALDENDKYPYNSKKGYMDYYSEAEHVVGINGASKETNNNIALSLIVPAYNSEKHISKCLESLLNQTTHYNYEVIIINDGSSDGTEDVIKSYLKDERLRYYFQDNHGIAYTRNLGLALSYGKYVGFIDNDDTVDNNYVETLLSRAMLTDAEVVKCGHIMHLPDGGHIPFCNNDASFDDGLGNSITEYNGYIWGGISKKSIWETVCFPENYWYEDMITRLLIFSRIKRFEYIGSCIYHKYEHSTNASRTIWSKANPKCLDQVFLLESCVRRLQELGCSIDTGRIKSILRECGPILYERVGDTYLRQSVTELSGWLKTVNTNYSGISDELKYSERLLLVAIMNSDLDLYKKVINYIRYE